MCVKSERLLLSSHIIGIIVKHLHLRLLYLKHLIDITAFNNENMLCGCITIIIIILMSD